MSLNQLHKYIQNKSSSLLINLITYETTQLEMELIILGKLTGAEITLQKNIVIILNKKETLLPFFLKKEKRKKQQQD